MPDRRSRRGRIAAVAAIVVVLLSASVAVAASRGYFSASHRVDRQLLAWQGQNQSFDGPGWHRVAFGAVGDGEGGEPAPTGLWFYSRQEAAVTVTGTLAGGPAQIRVLDTGRKAKPGKAHFFPRKGGTTFSFTFVSRAHGNGPCRGLNLELRSPTGAKLTLKNVNLVAAYKAGSTEAGAACND
jgi:hypothetical protein